MTEKEKQKENEKDHILEKKYLIIYLVFILIYYQNELIHLNPD